jgi:hypothetical protein
LAEDVIDVLAPLELGELGNDAHIVEPRAGLGFLAELV